MWKALFEISDRIFAIMPMKKWREYLRVWVLFDYRRKLNALKSEYPELDFRTMQLTKGGGSLVFIVENKIIFKVRKRNNETSNFERFTREKRITDAIRKYCTIQIPTIEFVTIGDYTFYKSDFIPGKLLVDIPTKKIKEYQSQLSMQLAEFIYRKSFANPVELFDLKSEYVSGYCWNHGDMCSNILVNPKNMKITGIIDWEWANYGSIDNEFNGLVWVRKKMRKIGLDRTTKDWYLKIKDSLPG